MDQTKSIELQKKCLESAEERARARASSTCALTCRMIKVVQLKSLEKVLN